MRSFFLKSYLAIIAFSVAMFVLIVSVIFEPVLLKSDWKDFKEELVVDHQLLMLKLDQTPPARWEQAIDEYQPIFGMVPELIDRSSLTSSEFRRFIESGTSKVLSPFSEDIWYGLFSLPDSQKILKISEDGSPLSDLSKEDVIWLILPILLITLSQAFGVILIIRAISKPIQQLSNSVEEFGKGHYHKRIHIYKAPVQQLAISFNNMADEIENKINEQQILVGAIPHELRTPLSRIRFALDLTRDKSSLDELHGQIEKIDHYVDDLDSIVESVLELTRMISGQINPVPFDLNALLTSVAENNAGSPIPIKIECATDLSADGHEGLIQQAVNNLVQNANRFADTTIVVRAFTEGSDLIIQVDDDGPGVSQEKLEEIFILFARLDKSRNQETGGLGLGLSLVKLIMQQHNGSATATNLQPHGLRVTLRCPHGKN